MGDGLVAALSELAPALSRGRTTLDVLRIAGEGVARLGMRFAVLQLLEGDLVLRFPANSAAGREFVDRGRGRRPVDRRLRLDQCEPATSIFAQHKSVYRSDLAPFTTIFEPATGGANARTTTSGVVTPVFVREKPWGLLVIGSPSFAPGAAAAVSLFGAHVAAAIETAEFRKALDRAQEKLVAGERLAALGELAATLAHEVRNPLGVLHNSVSLLRQLMRRDLDQEARSSAHELIAIVSEETGRLDAVVTDLLALARPTAIRTREAVLENIVRTITDVVPNLSGGSAIDVHLDFAPDLPSIVIDDRLVRQALLNLVINALQAMPHGGTLTIGTRLEFRDQGPFACVDVTDTGSGIAAEHRARVFEPFFTTKPTGTGLGLPLVKRIVDAHRGELAVVSDSGGTTFTVRLPLPTDKQSHVTLKRGAAADRHLRAVGTEK